MTKIGIFDSGIGGVTVLKEIIKLLPNHQYIYYSDSKNNPYGDKSSKEIKYISEEITKFLISKGCYIIVIACNTASAEASKYLREKYQDIIFIAIEPAYKMVHDYAFKETTLVMATKTTIASKKFNELLQKYNNHNTILKPCPMLADIIEENNQDQIIKYLKENILPYKGKVKNVVLGCTHYPLIEKEINSVLGDVNIFNGATGVAFRLKDILEKNKLIDNKEKYKIEFHDSSNLNIKEKRFFEILEK